MREIKFRVWDGKKMTYPRTIEIGINGVNGLTSGAFQLEDGGYCTTAYIMQYTGLKDKNGKEIYEGDIVQFETGTSRQVIYQPPSFILKKRPTDRTWTEFVLAYTENQLEKVIGNIYESPKLLEESK